MKFVRVSANLVFTKFVDFVTRTPDQLSLHFYDFSVICYAFLKFTAKLRETCIQTLKWKRKITTRSRGSRRRGGSRRRRRGAARRMAGGVASAQVSRDTCVREERPRGHLGVLNGPSWIQLAANAPWTRSTGGVLASDGAAKGWRGNRDSFVNFKSLGTCR